jgi:enoyl-CoA hydratase/carnithine racemase
VLICRLYYLASTAKMGLVETRLAIIPGGGDNDAFVVIVNFWIVTS